MGINKTGYSLVQLIIKNTEKISCAYSRRFTKVERPRTRRLLHDLLCHQESITSEYRLGGLGQIVFNICGREALQDKSKIKSKINCSKF